MPNLTTPHILRTVDVLSKIVADFEALAQGNDLGTTKFCVEQRLRRTPDEPRFSDLRLALSDVIGACVVVQCAPDPTSRAHAVAQLANKLTAAVMMAELMQVDGAEWARWDAEFQRRGAMGVLPRLEVGR